MSNLEQKTVEILDKLDAAISHYSPQVYDAAVSAVQVSAAGQLIQGALWMIFLIFSWSIAKKINSAVVKGFDESTVEVIQCVSFIFYVVLVVLAFLFSCLALCDTWSWVAIFNPKLALAHKIMGL